MTSRWAWVAAVVLGAVLNAGPAGACPCSDDPGGRGFMTAAGDAYAAALSSSSRQGLGQFDARGRLRRFGSAESEASQELLFRLALRLPQALEWQAELGAGSYHFHTETLSERRHGLGDGALRAHYALVEEGMPHERFRWPAVAISGLVRAPLGSVASGQSRSFGSGGVQLGLGAWELGAGAELQRSLVPLTVWWSAEVGYRFADQALGRTRRLGPRADFVLGASLELANWLSASTTLAARFVGDVSLSGRTLEGTGERLVSAGSALTLRDDGLRFRSSVGVSLDPPIDGLSKNTAAAWALNVTLGFSR